MKAVVVTVSDRVSRGEAEDRSGAVAVAALEAMGFDVSNRVVPDGVEPVEAALREAVDGGASLVVTTGGTGLSPRDLTPEATLRVVEREAPGLSEAMRAATFGSDPHGMLSRGVSGIVGMALIVNLPGSVTGVEESLEVIAPALRHAVNLVAGIDDPHDRSH